MQNPIICAHAAGADLGPANTVQAAKKSLGTLQPRDCIEVDVQETRDGELVLTHGDITDEIRFALGYSGTIKDITLADLKTIKPGVNTLGEMLGEINSRCGVMLDVKDPSIQVGKLREIMAPHTGEIWLTASNDKILREAITEAAEWPRIVQCRMATRRQIDKAIQSTKPHSIDIWPIFLSKKTANYIRYHRLGFMAGGMPEPFSRTGENPDRIRKWIEWGTNCIVTFNPEKIRRLLESGT